MNKRKYDDGQWPPRRRAGPCSHVLTENDASLIKGMLGRGDALHCVAAYFGVNSARIAEIKNSERFADVPVAAACDLPPPGPYTSPRDLTLLQAELSAAEQALERAARIIRHPLT